MKIKEIIYGLGVSKREATEIHKDITRAKGFNVHIKHERLYVSSKSGVKYRYAPICCQWFLDDMKVLDSDLYRDELWYLLDFDTAYYYYVREKEIDGFIKGGIEYRKNKLKYYEEVNGVQTYNIMFIFLFCLLIVLIVFICLF